MKFKKLDEPVTSDDPYYDLFDGGYIKPENLLEDKKDIEKVNEAVELVAQFLSEAEKHGSIEVI